jgi:murein L,D-transpeptidase YcbB/YkuD
MLLAGILLGPAPAPAEGAAAPSSPAIAEAIQQALAPGAALPRLRHPLDLDALRRFYGGRGYGPVWSGEEGAEARADALRQALAHADEDGLDPGDYHRDTLAKRGAPPADPGEAAADDLLLTDAFLRYAHDLRLGRVRPDEVYSDVILPPQIFDAAAALAAALKTGRFAELLAALPPGYPAYARLKEALKRYRAILAEGGWPQIPRAPGQRELKLDGSDPRAEVLRQRLAIEDNALAERAGGAQPEDLADAVRRFQKRNGIDPDGRVGLQTLAMLNITAAQRVSQIIANLERWRWLPRQLEPRHVEVNTADGSLQAVADGKVVLASKVIVGDEKHATPILRAVAVAVTVNPPWRVPDSIARKEILPKLRRDPGYLQSENIVILNGPEGDPFGLTIDWSGYSRNRFPYRLEQLPGPNNALGGVKLEMPNRFDVYLHDTPTQKLFARVVRNFSHGCIRVEAALALASFAMTGDTGAAIDGLKDEIAEGATRHHAVRPPLPVWVLYWTALEDENGKIEFRPDAYGRDRHLAAALASYARHIPVAKMPLANSAPKTDG